MRKTGFGPLGRLTLARLGIIVELYLCHLPQMWFCDVWLSTTTGEWSADWNWKKLLCGVDRWDVGDSKAQVVVNLLKECTIFEASMMNIESNLRGYTEPK
ncbi:hypothetical protein EV2_009617 [Malus domestica]